MMSRFTFHIGPHKMATTFLQRSCNKGLRNKTAVGDIGGASPDETGRLFYIGAGQDLVQNARKELVKAYGTKDLVSALGAARVFFETVVKPVSRFSFAAIINENFMGPQLGQGPVWRRLYPNCVLNAVFHAELQSLAAAAEIDYRIVLSIREQASFVESSYVNVVRDSGRYVSFADYRNRFDERALLWSAFVREYTDKLGRDAVTVIPFETISAGPQAFMDRFSAVFWPGASLPAVKERVREGMSSVALNILKDVSGHEEAEPVPRKVVLALLEHLPKGEYGSPALFTPEEKQAYRARYAADNRSVFDQFAPGETAVFEKAYV